MYQSRRSPLGQKLKCPKCSNSNLNAIHTKTGGIDVICKKCKTVIFGIGQKQPPQPNVVDEAIKEVTTLNVDNGNQRTN